MTGKEKKIGSGSARLLFFCLALVVLILPSLCHAAAGDSAGWQVLGLYGGLINAIAIDPVAPHIMFAGSYYGDGLFKSTDGGATIRQVMTFAVPVNINT